MMRKIKQPIKVIDNFFEAPSLWRHYALKQEYNNENADWPGVRSRTLNELNLKLFNSFASKIITHTHNSRYFSFLKINFVSVDSSYSFGKVHQDDPQYNISGIIFLNKEPLPKSGISFFHKTAEPYKEERDLFKKNMTVENVFNRCVMFSPDKWHAADSYFGNTLEDSRLTINFFGIAV